MAAAMGGGCAALGEGWSWCRVVSCRCDADV